MRGPRSSLERVAHFLGGCDLGGGCSIRRVLMNPQIKIFHANWFLNVFIDLKQLTDPQATTARPLVHYVSIPLLGLTPASGIYPTHSTPYPPVKQSTLSLYSEKCGVFKVPHIFYYIKRGWTASSSQSAYALIRIHVSAFTGSQHTVRPVLSNRS